MALEKNNEQIADIIEKWILGHVEEPAKKRSKF